MLFVKKTIKPIRDYHALIFRALLLTHLVISMATDSSFHTKGIHFVKTNVGMNFT